MQGGPSPEHLTFLLWHSRHLVRDWGQYRDCLTLQPKTVPDDITYAIGRREGVADIFVMMEYAQTAKCW